MKEYKVLSGNTLKMLAALFMTVDHIGVLFFPRVITLRIIGRLAYPIFAFMLAEGAKYTKNKLRYFSLMAALAALCQIVYYFFDGGSLYMCILVTFSLSLIMIFALDLFKRCFFDRKCPTLIKAFSFLLFLLSVIAVYVLNEHLTIDYGFCGSLVPLFASIPNFRGTDAPECIKRLDNLYVRIALLAVGLLILSIDVKWVEEYSLFSVILLLCYSERRGKYNMKYFFYLFYPLHLVALEGIYLLCRVLK